MMAALKYLNLLGLVLTATFLASAAAQVRPGLNQSLPTPEPQVAQEALLAQFEAFAELNNSELFFRQFRQAQSVIFKVPNSNLLMIFNWDHKPDVIAGYTSHDSSSLRFALIEASGSQLNLNYELIGSNSLVDQLQLEGQTTPVQLPQAAESFLFQILEKWKNDQPLQIFLRMRTLVNSWHPVSQPVTELRAFKQIVKKYELNCPQHLSD